MISFSFAQFSKSSLDYTRTKAMQADNFHVGVTQVSLQRL